MVAPVLVSALSLLVILTLCNSPHSTQGLWPMCAPYLHSLTPAQKLILMKKEPPTGLCLDCPETKAINLERQLQSPEMSDKPNLLDCHHPTLRLAYRSDCFFFFFFFFLPRGTACRILVPRPRIKPAPHLHWKLDHLGSPQISRFLSLGFLFLDQRCNNVHCNNSNSTEIYTIEI